MPLKKIIDVKNLKLYDNTKIFHPEKVVFSTLNWQKLKIFSNIKRCTIIMISKLKGGK
jgi:hypothetical protein